MAGEEGEQQDTCFCCLEAPVLPNNPDLAGVAVLLVVSQHMHDPACFYTRRWREYRGMRNDFSLLDRNGGAGFDLASKLLSTRNSFYRCERSTCPLSQDASQI